MEHAFSQESRKLQVIAHIHTEFPEKFGLPRQSGLVPGLQGEIVFTEEYRQAESLRGLEDFSHIWLLWGFSAAERKGWSPTVRPPRLGGNKRMGVFATRSPLRPNPIGLSCVKLEEICLQGPNGPILRVSGADLMDGTPIYDIKPYLPYTDSRPEASGGFAEPLRDYRLEVDIPVELLERIPKERQEALREVLAQDPRPSYQQDPERVYGMDFAGMALKFTVQDGRLQLLSLEKQEEKKQR